MYITCLVKCQVLVHKTLMFTNQPQQHISSQQFFRQLVVQISCHQSEELGYCFVSVFFNFILSLKTNLITNYLN